MFPMISQHRQQILHSDGTEFPARAYKDLVLEPAYNQAKANFIVPMIQIHEAHLIMLVEAGIIDKNEVKKIVEAIRKINIAEVQQSTYDTSFEDLFFRIEAFLIQEAGDLAGNLHIARSRNDMGI